MTSDHRRHPEVKRRRPGFTQPERQRGGSEAAMSAGPLRAYAFMFIQHVLMCERSYILNKRDIPAAAGLSCGYANVTAAENRRFNHSSFPLPITSHPRQ